MAILNQFITNTVDQLLVKSMETRNANNNRQNAFTACACASVLFTNNMKHVHLHASGEDFDKIHDLCQQYYDKGADESDYLEELSLENNSPVPNPSVMGQYTAFPIETSTAYDYEDCLFSVTNSVAVYVEYLTSLRESDMVTTDIQSKLDDIIRDWKKEMNYKLKNRMAE